MDAACVSVLWAFGRDAKHHVVEFGLSAVATLQNALLESPKAHAHVVERDSGDEVESSGNRVAVAAFELWRESE